MYAGDNVPCPRGGDGKNVSGCDQQGLCPGEERFQFLPAALSAHSSLFFLCGGVKDCNVMPIQVWAIATVLEDPSQLTHSAPTSRKRASAGRLNSAGAQKHSDSSNAASEVFSPAVLLLSSNEARLFVSLSHRLCRLDSDGDGLTNGEARETDAQ